MWKITFWTVRAGYVQGEFSALKQDMRLDRLLQIPHPFKISSQAGMQRLFRREKSLTGLYVQNTPRNDFSRWNKICARTGQNFKF